eukprot:3409928-Rhodomonas_salina.1
MMCCAICRPTPHKLGEELDQWKARTSVGFTDLLACRSAPEKDPLFRNREGVAEFISHYRRFDFLKPIEFDEYGPEIKNQQDKKTKELEHRLAKSMGIKTQTLKEYAQENLDIAKKKKLEKEGSKASESDPMRLPAGVSQPRG